MRMCPKCKKWSLDFDGYFGRFRCFDCGWMAASATEREIRLRQNHSTPIELLRQPVEALGMKISALYDKENDALIFNFGTEEPTFELPEADGKMIWQICRSNGMVGGFVIVGAKQIGVEKIEIGIAARKNTLEKRLSQFMDVLSSGGATRILVDSVIVKATTKDESPEDPELKRALEEAFDEYQKVSR